MNGPPPDVRSPTAAVRPESTPVIEARPSVKPKGGSFTGRAFVLALVAAVLFITLAVPVRAWFAQRAEIAGLRADVESARERVAALQTEKARWDDPAFVAAEARRRLLFVLPGEVGFVTLGSESTLAAADTDPGPATAWYTALWASLQEADNHANPSGADLAAP